MDMAGSGSGLGVTSLSLNQICTQMPKVELHAHLNGCITHEILESIREEQVSNKSSFEGSCSLYKSPDSLKLTLDDCWKAFARVHNAITSPEIVYSATCKVIDDFSRDNVVYLELRSTPKKVHAISSKDSYIDSIVRAIVDSRKKYSTLVKLLISVDRRNGESDALDNVELTREWAQRYPDVVVGLDISGDPSHGNIEWISNVIKQAKKFNLPVSCHLSEIGNLDETLELLRLRPDRVAHGQFLHPLTGGTKELWEEFKRSQIPMETCISSNVISGVSPSMEQHFVQYLVQDELDFAICTDDSAVFLTTVSKEYMTLLKMAPMSVNKLQELCLRSVSFAFASDAEKEKITSVIAGWWTDNMNSQEDMS